MTEAIAKRPSGLDLQFERKAAGLTQDQVAVGLGVTRQRIAAIEGARFPSPKATEQYLATLARVAPGGIDAGNVDVEVGPGSSGRSRRAAGSVGGRQ
jgi:transcriptional regulator with XRE-family HTH domain